MSTKLIQFIQSACIIFSASIITMICSYIATGESETVAIRDIFYYAWF